jgi:hypothetical protein
MGVSVHIDKASGRALCKACKAKIEKDTKAICISGFQSNYYFHETCLKDIFKKIPPNDNPQKKICLFSGGAQFSKITISLKKTTGKATCPVCDKIITDNLEVLIELPDASNHYHPACMKKIYETW